MHGTGAQLWLVGPEKLLSFVDYTAIFRFAVVNYWSKCIYSLVDYCQHDKLGRVGYRKKTKRKKHFLIFFIGSIYREGHWFLKYC